MREFEERYGRDHVKFEERGYADVAKHVKENLLFLVVILVSEEHDDTPAFCKDILCDDALKEWLQSNECIIWGGNVADAEAHTGITDNHTSLIQVSNSLNCTRYPFVGLIANVPSPTPTSLPQMTLLTRIEGPVVTNQLVSALATAATRNLSALSRRRALKREQEQTRELRRMQEEAYHNSLAQDRAKAEQERLAALEAERLEREQREKALIIERKAQKREQWRVWKANDLRKKDLIGMKSEIGKTARVGLRLANGERIVQIFPGDMAVTEVYAFVDCYDLLFPVSSAEVTLRTAGEATVSGEFEKPEDYEHDYLFRLVVPMPRKVIENASHKIREESALWPSGSIVVEKFEDGSEEDSEEETE